PHLVVFFTTFPPEVLSRAVAPRGTTRLCHPRRTAWSPEKSATTICPTGLLTATAITVVFQGLLAQPDLTSLTISLRDSHVRYGAQVGAVNLVTIFAHYDLRVTFFLNAWDVERYPRTMEAIAAAGHEMAVSGYLHEDFSTLTIEEQAEVLARSEMVFQSA